MIIRRVISIVVGATGLISGTPALPQAPDREIVSTVLKHFAARTDAYFYDLQGVLLIWPATATAKGISMYSGLEATEGECPASPSLYEALHSRNTATRPVSELLDPSGQWRLVKESEKKSVSPALPPPPNGPKRPPTKTLVTLYQPAYSSSGDTALVLFHFVWSMHGAAARYVVQRSELGWEVKCSKLVFYV